MKFYNIIKNRGPKTSFCACFLFPFIGMLYLGRWKWALIYLSLSTIPSLFIENIFNLQSNAIQKMDIIIGLTIALIAARHGYNLSKNNKISKNLKFYARACTPIISIFLLLFPLLIVLALPSRIFLYEPLHIPSQSMEPILHIDDYIFAQKFAYGYSRYSMPFNIKLWEGKLWETPPQRGDIIIFKLEQRPNIIYTKRIIGLPNDTIQMKDGTLYINGEKEDQIEIEDYIYSSSNNTQNILKQYKTTLPDGTSFHIIRDLDSPSIVNDTTEYHIPKNHYFVMGDNRDKSQDSRIVSMVGMVHKDYIIGKMMYKYFNTNTGFLPLEKVQ